VYGNGSYADAWFEKSGLTNVAKDVKGCAEVSMEQLYDWNPDYIFVFIGSPASAMQNNKIDGQDWSLLSAYENKRIIDIPQSIFSWGAPCSDSPLMPLWLTSQCYSELLSKNTFKTLYSDYYNRMYNIELKDELMESILSPRKPKK
jgi:iron complex transport system substrate-binding protein